MGGPESWWREADEVTAVVGERRRDAVQAGCAIDLDRGAESLAVVNAVRAADGQVRQDLDVRDALVGDRDLTDVREEDRRHARFHDGARIFTGRRHGIVRPGA